MDADRCRIVCGDCREVLDGLEERSADCCITSPPYFNLRDYDGQDEGSIGAEETPQQYVSDLASCLDGVMRVLKDDGTLWLNVGDSFARKDFGSIRRKERIGVPFMLALALRLRGWRMRQDLVWSKPNAMPESVRDRFTCCHEYLFLFTKSEDYYFDGEEALEEALDSGERRTIRFGGSKYGDSDDPRHGGKSGKSWKPTVRTVDGRDVVMRRMRDVWSISSPQYSGAHFATFPERLVDPCVRIGCRPGGLVLDPFSGAGTTGLAALRNGRRYLGVEVSPKYYELQRERISSELGGMQ